MSARWVSNPLETLLTVFNARWERNVSIRWVQNIQPMEPFGRTLRVRNRRNREVFIIELWAGMPYIGLMDVLAHELAHVIADRERQKHGPRWKRAYRTLRRDYLALIGEKRRAA